MARDILVLLFLMWALFPAHAATAQVRPWSDARVEASKLTKQDLVEIARRAEAGEARAQLLLGHACAYGYGTRKKESDAMKWYHKAAAQGNAEAQFSLAKAYTDGVGLRRNPAEAIKWSRRAAEQGLVDAQANLGALYLEQGNCAEGHKWTLIAAEAGDLLAQANLTLWHLKGDCLPRDHLSAYMWSLVARAARCGQPPQLCVEREFRLDAYTQALQQAAAAELSSDQRADGRRRASDWLVAHLKGPLPADDPETWKVTFLVSHYHAGAAAFGGRFVGADRLDYCHGWLTITKDRIRYASLNRDDGFEASPSQVLGVDKFEPSEMSGIDYETIYIRLDNRKNYSFVVLSDGPIALTSDHLLDALKKAVPASSGARR